MSLAVQILVRPSISISYYASADAVSLFFGARRRHTSIDTLWPSVVGDVTNLRFDLEGRLLSLEMLSARTRLLPALLASHDPIGEGLIDYSYHEGSQTVRFTFLPLSTKVTEYFASDKQIVLAMDESRRLAWIDILEPARIPAGFELRIES